MLVGTGANPRSRLCRAGSGVLLRGGLPCSNVAAPGMRPVRNALLSALDASELRELSRHLEPVPLRPRQVLQERNLPVTHAYFVERGIASLLSRAGERGSLEVGIVGVQGFVGLPVVLGTLRSPHRCVVQVGGEALRIGTEPLQRAMSDIPRLRALLLGYVQAVMVQSAQLVVCNTRHSLSERLARSLLLAHDRLGGNEVPLTHQSLSRLLGVRRAGVTTAVGQMERAGLIRRGRGRLVISDVQGLQHASCECYRAINAEHDRILSGGRCHDLRAQQSPHRSMPVTTAASHPPELSAVPC